MPIDLSATTSTGFTTGLKFIDPKVGNVLNNYRSYTYNFTLDALPTEFANDPKKWQLAGAEAASASYRILKSGGKGTTGLAGAKGPTTAQVEANNLTQQYTEDPAVVKQSQKDIDLLKFNVDLIPEFNKSSPGRFDFFIDKWEMTTSYSPSDLYGFIPNANFNFTVVEPYSINGFLEVLHAASVAAGYTSYMAATFLMTLKFLGYPDNDSADSPAGPEEVPHSTRSWLINITNASLEVTEKGSVYVCQATVTSGFAVADSNNKLKKSITFEGRTVQDCLAGPLDSERPANYAGNDFVTKVNLLQKESTKDRTGSDIYDEYRVYFPEVTDTGDLDYTKVNKIGRTKLADNAQLLKSSGMEDPQTTEKKTNYKNKPEDTSTEITKLDPATGKYQLQFPESFNISDLITNIIRDSEFYANLLKSLKENSGSVIDQHGYIDYFRLRTEVELSKSINPETKKPKSIFKFIVTPFKVHISNLSKGMPTPLWDATKYPPFVVRTYDYMYTGKNVDVINFKLSLNGLYHAVTPVELNNDVIQSTYGAGPSNSTDITFKNLTSSNDVAQLQNGAATSRAGSVPYVPKEGPGLPKSDSPYRNIARSIHTQFLNFHEAAMSLTVDIIGDPLYIATNGMNGLIQNKDGAGFTSNGEADFITYQVPVSITFRNPVDIGKSGFMDFSEDQIPYSGIYQVTSINNYFNEGIFKQRLNMTRLSGQLEGKPIKVKDYSDLFEESANPLDQITTDTTEGTPNVAGKVSDATIKRLGGTVLSNLGKAAALVGAAGLLKNVSGQAATVLAASLAVPAVIGVAKSAIDTVNSLASKATGLIGDANKKVASAPNVSSSTDPTNNITAAAKANIPVDILTQDQLANIPKSAPPATAPGPQVDVSTLQSLYKSGGVAAIAKAYGVKDITNISPTELPLGTVKMIEETITPSNPLTTLKGVVANASSVVDASIVTDKLASAQTLLNGAQSVVTIIPRDASQATSILTQAGSNVTSPLTKILQG
jgi:hypothetical protein